MRTNRGISGAVETTGFVAKADLEPSVDGERIRDLVAANRKLNDALRRAQLLREAADRDRIAAEDRLERAGQVLLHYAAALGGSGIADMAGWVNSLNTMFRELAELTRKDQELRSIEPPLGPTTDLPRAPIAMPIAMETRCCALYVASLGSGGLERVVVELSREFEVRGLKVLVIAEGKIGELGHELHNDGVRVLSLENEPGGLRAVLEREEVDVLSLHHAYGQIEQLREWSGRVIETIHNYYIWQRTNDLLRQLREEIFAGFIAVSSGVKDYSIRHLGIDGNWISVVPNGHPLRQFIRPSEKRLRSMRAERSTFDFIHVANFFPVKAHSALIRAFEPVAARYGQSRLHLVGADPGGGTEGIREVVLASDCQSQVTVHGGRTHRELSKLYCQAKCFILPSVIEGWSMSILEAMYFGLPMILTRVGSATDIVSDGDIGVVIPPYLDVDLCEDIDSDYLRLVAPSFDTGPLSDAMMQMITHYNDRWHDAGYKGMALFEKFNLDHMVASYLRAFELDTLRQRSLR